MTNERRKRRTDELDGPAPATPGERALAKMDPDTRAVLERILERDREILERLAKL